MSVALVSVIIPVYNNGQELKVCLQALARQTYQDLEVVVIDNASSESIVPISIGKFPIRLGYESQRGSYAARNRGIKIAQGEIIAFTDADCIPEPDWVEKGVAKLSNQPGIGVAGGRVELFPVDPHRFTLAEIYESFSAFRQDRSLHLKHYSATANLFTYRNIIDQVGPFRGDLVSGGDVEWCQRVYQAGYQLVYAEEAGVRHPMRHTLIDLAERHRRFARAEYDLQGLSGFSFGQIFCYALASLLPPPGYLIRILRTRRVRRVQDRALIFMVDEFVRGVKAWEIIQLWRFDVRRQILHGSHR